MYGSEQRVILLTGASRGIGHATVRKFSEEKWRVITCSRQAFDPKCPWPGGEENHIQVDLSNPNNTLHAIEEIKDRLNGKLHALVNNAGIPPKNEKGNRLDSINTDLSTWGQVFHVNFFASVILARGLQKALVKSAYSNMALGNYLSIIVILFEVDRSLWRYCPLFLPD